MTGESKEDGATAFHTSTSGREQHIVGIGNLRVMILKTDTYWYAQGLEIDYSAQGGSLEEVTTRFGSGLHSTIDEHLMIYGNIKNILVPAPEHIWSEFVGSKDHLRAKYSQVGLHEMFPFDDVAFYSREEAAVTV